MPPDLEALARTRGEGGCVEKENIEKKVIIAKEWISVWDICKQSSVCTAFPPARDQQLQLKSVFLTTSGLPRSAQVLDGLCYFCIPM